MSEKGFCASESVLPPHLLPEAVTGVEKRDIAQPPRGDLPQETSFRVRAPHGC